MVTISKLFLAAQHHFVLMIVLVLAILLLGQHFFTTNLNHARVLFYKSGDAGTNNYKIHMFIKRLAGPPFTLPAGCRRFGCLQALLGT